MTLPVTEHVPDSTARHKRSRRGRSLWQSLSQTWSVGRYVCLYLMAIVVANLLTAWLGAWITPYSASILIGLDLTVKDRLQDRWTKGLFWKMGALIGTGSALSWLLNRAAGRIALASFVAFAVSGTIDAVVYYLLRGKERWRRVSWSNLFGAVTDSVIFPAIAFGWPPDPAIVYGQMAAKAMGGQFWALVLK